MNKFLASNEWLVTHPAHVNWEGVDVPERQLTIRLLAFVADYNGIKEVYLGLESKHPDGEFYGFDDACLPLYEVKHDDVGYFLQYINKYWKYDFDQSEIVNEIARLVKWMEEQSK